MKVEWLVADVTPVGPPDRAEGAISGMFFGLYWPIQAFVVGEPFYDVSTLSRALITLLMAI